MIWLLTGGLLAGVVLVLWPSTAARERLPQLRGDNRRARFDPAWVRRWMLEALPRSSRRAVPAMSALAAGPAFLLGGPVAAGIAAVYAGLTARELVRRAAHKRVVAGRAAALDGLCALVADLRAGVPPAVVATHGAGSVPTGPPVRSVGIGAPGESVRTGLSAGAVPTGPPVGDERIASLAAAVWRLAEQTGAPAADLLERIEADARTADRAARAAAAQAAGAQATAFLLAALPVGGIGLGYAIGADPLEVLLHTPVGAGSAVLAVVLQCAGLRWAQQLTDGLGG